MKLRTYISLLYYVARLHVKSRFKSKATKQSLAQMQEAAKDFEFEPIFKNGFGGNATGGEGGVKYYVKTESELRLAINQTHTRIIYIKGIINLSSALNIYIGNLSIFGVTGEDGVYGAGTYVYCKNFIFDGIQFAATDLDVTKDHDALAFRSSAENGIVTRSVASFGVDENVDVWGAKNITIEYCLISHALRNSHHSEGSHSMGMLIGSGAKNLSILNNIFAFNQNRHARVGADSEVEYINNIIYGHKTNYVLSENSTNTIVNNVYLQGTQEVTHNKLVDVTDATGVKVYIKGNVNDFGADEMHRDLENINLDVMPIYSGAEIKPTEGLLEDWYKTVKPKSKYVKQVIKDVQKKRGHIIDSQNEL